MTAARLLLGALIVASLMTTAACGGDGGGSDESAIRKVAGDYLDASADGDAGKACDRISDRYAAQLAASVSADDCEAAVTARLRLLPDDQQEALGEAEIETVTITDDSATVETSGSDAVLVVRRIGEDWLLDGQAQRVGDEIVPTVEQAPREQVADWPARWCSVELGMTPGQAAELMGPATRVSEESLEWGGLEYQFNAFMGDDGTIRQLDIVESKLSPEQRSAIGCETTRKASPG